MVESVEHVTEAIKVTGSNHTIPSFLLSKSRNYAICKRIGKKCRSLWCLQKCNIGRCLFQLLFLIHLILFPPDICFFSFKKDRMFSVDPPPPSSSNQNFNPTHNSPRHGKPILWLAKTPLIIWHTVVSGKKGTFICELMLERYIYLRSTQKQLKITNYVRNKSFLEFYLV